MRRNLGWSTVRVQPVEMAIHGIQLPAQICIQIELMGASSAVNSKVQAYG